MDARPNASVCGRTLAETVGSNPAGGMDVYLWRVLCELTGRGLCDELITRSEETYRLWCVVVCDVETSTVRRTWAEQAVAQQVQINSIHDFQ